MNIPITKAIFDEAEEQAIVKPLKTGWVVQGPYVAEFEKRFAAYTNAQFAKAASSCTTALHLGLEAMGIGAGDKVVVPSFTYVASANAVEYTGAKVVFCDIDLATFNIDIKALERLLSEDKSITAIMPVHLFGLCANMPTILHLAKQYNLKIIEDAACAFDAWIGNQHAGTFGDCGCFSFHPRKAITTGEGGMLTTNDEALYTMVSQLADHGASKTDLQRHQEKTGSLLPDFNLRGFNYRMTDFQGALGLCQMDKAESIMAGRRKIAAQYDKALASIVALKAPFVPEDYRHAYQSYVCLFVGQEDLSNLTVEKIDRLNKQRNSFMQHLADKNIATRQGTHAVHTLGYYKNRYQLSDADFISAYAADRLSVALPVYAGMSDEEFDYVKSTMFHCLKY
ncbi:MAG: aminotransferase DegT [Gammaproteobacteria bacterium CG11_big_fil_rev_8_21_14_0_20_46_22]|nr:MAG: aminotransferase DegT [Gammaproteobacteria bacterium CG12_big_fil_rev_8_21_14_0_65_46_12]PIR12145.1 MAG: aminotransferase DegT [Gammaproteobacteria bacterium CG11_big_fil_rev_8_21_14_0_20_46_22]